MKHFKLLILFCVMVFVNSAFCVSYVVKPGETNQVAGCSHLTTPEQAFAMKLSALQRDLFCKRYSPAQRAKAMAIYDQNSNRNFSADQAVEQVLTESRGQGMIGPEDMDYGQSPCEQYGKY